MAEVEMVSVVDFNDVVIGEVPRIQLVDRRVNFRVVHVLARNRAGKILLQRPAISLRKPFRLGSSVAGHVRAGESYVDAARREYQEELGLDPPTLEFLGRTWVDETDRRKFVGVFVAHEDREVRPDGLEVEGVEELTVSEVERLLRIPGAVSETFLRVFRFASDAGALRGG